MTPEPPLSGESSVDTETTILVAVLTDNDPDNILADVADAVPEPRRVSWAC